MFPKNMEKLERFETFGSTFFELKYRDFSLQEKF